MRRKKVLFIVNPRSGKGQIRNALLDIADIFIKGGLDVTLYVTQKPQDASRVVGNGLQSLILSPAAAVTGHWMKW